jgi:hypothetical protein
LVFILLVGIIRAIAAERSTAFFASAGIKAKDFTMEAFQEFKFG